MVPAHTGILDTGRCLSTHGDSYKEFLLIHVWGHSSTCGHSLDSTEDSCIVLSTVTIYTVRPSSFTYNSHLFVYLFVYFIIYFYSWVRSPVSTTTFYILVLVLVLSSWSFSFHRLTVFINTCLSTSIWVRHFVVARVYATCS